MFDWLTRRTIIIIVAVAGLLAGAGVLAASRDGDGWDGPRHHSLRVVNDDGSATALRVERDWGGPPGPLFALFALTRLVLTGAIIVLAVRWFRRRRGPGEPRAGDTPDSA